MTLAQDLPIAMPTSLRKFSPYLASCWKHCGEAGTFVECWWPCSEQFWDNRDVWLSWLLQEVQLWKGWKSSRQMRCRVVLGDSLWDPRESFFSMSGLKPCRSTCQLYGYSKILIQVVQTTKTSTFNLKLQFNWDEWLSEGTNYILTYDSV